MAHWLARENGTNRLQLKASLIAFHRLRGSHSGDRIARIVLHILDRVGITVEVCRPRPSTGAYINSYLGRPLDPGQCREQYNFYESA